MERRSPSTTPPAHARVWRVANPMALPIFLVLLVGGSGCLTNAFARKDAPATEPIAVLDLLQEETVGLAALHEQPISDAPSNVYVITEEDIRHSGAMDIPTLLRRVPGLEVMQTTGADYNVSMRGDNQLLANKLLVQVDGRSITVDAQALTFWKLIPVTLPEIKRIEVLKGPAGAIHGFNAFDGVVNIITKSPKEMRGVTLQTAGGEFDTIRSSAIYGDAHGPFSYRLSAGYDQTSDWDDRNTTALRAYRFNAHTEYRLREHARLRLIGGVVKADEFNSPISDAGSSPGNPLQPYVLVEYTTPEVLLRTYWNRTDTTNPSITHPALASILQTTALDGSTINDNLYDTYDVLGQHTLEWGTDYRLIYGANYRHNRTSASFLEKTVHEDRLGVFAQGEWKAVNTVTAVAGLRFDMNTFVNPTYSPRGALMFKPTPNHTLRAAISVGFRPPTAFENNVAIVTRVNLPPPGKLTTLQTRGSKNLDAEKIVSYELGYQGWFFNHRLRLRADLFYNHLEDLVRFLSLASNEPTSPINGGEGDIFGGEIGMEYLLTPWLSGFVNYSYQDFDVDFIGTSQRTGPQSKVNAGLRLDLENGWNGEVLWHYVGPTTFPLSSAFSTFSPVTGIPPPNPRIGSYALLNVRAAYQFWEDHAPKGHRRYAEAAVSVFNALNDRHREHPLGETIKSRAMGWLTIHY